MIGLLLALTLMSDTTKGHAQVILADRKSNAFYMPVLRVGDTYLYPRSRKPLSKKWKVISFIPSTNKP